MKTTDENVDTFLVSDPELAEIDRIITEALPGLSRILWRGVFWGGTDQAIIGYGTIFEPRPRGEPVEWFLIGLARQKNHISLYVSAVENRQYLSKMYADRLGKVKAGAASLSFRKLEDIDQEVLTEMLQHAGRISETTSST